MTHGTHLRIRMKHCGLFYCTNLCTIAWLWLWIFWIGKVGSPTYSRQNCMTLNWPWFINLGLIFESTRFGLRDAPQKPWTYNERPHNVISLRQCDPGKIEATLPNILSTGDSHRRAHNNSTENVKGLSKSMKKLRQLSLWNFDIIWSIYDPWKIKACLIFEVPLCHKPDNVEYWFFLLLSSCTL